MTPEQVAELLSALKDVNSSRFLSGKLSITGFPCLRSTTNHPIVASITLALYDWILSFAGGMSPLLQRRRKLTDMQNSKQFTSRDGPCRKPCSFM